MDESTENRKVKLSVKCWKGDSKGSDKKQKSLFAFHSYWPDRPNHVLITFLPKK